MELRRWALAALAVAVATSPAGLDALQTTRQPRSSAPAPPRQPTSSETGADRAARQPGARSPRNASYSIEVRLDHSSRTLTGRAVVTWRNTSNQATSELPFHLYYNAWKNTRSTWLRGRALSRRAPTPRRAGDWGWIDVTSVRLLPGGALPVDLWATRRYLQPDDGNPDDQTVMAVTLPAPVAPGEAINIEVAWTSRVPRTFSRTGTVGSYYFIAQWFPKIGVLEDSGWNCHQFHAGTEFYADYGVYDVQITVPRGWVVGATGLETARRDNADGTTLHRYHAEDVHDFAWTTSPDFLERRARFEFPKLPPVDMRLLLQPEHASQAERHFEATRTALRDYGEWFGPYPYGYITIVDPAWQSGSGGMEYPTLFTAGSRWLAPARATTPEGVTIHEAGHQFWYGLVGNNEFEHAWLDEGLNTFSTGRAIATSPAYRQNFAVGRYFGGFVPWVFPDLPQSREVDENGLASYRATAESDVPATPSWRYHPASGGGISYSKTALWLHTLERYLGWPVLQRGMSTFFERWQYRHPRPQDFFGVINEVSGRDLTWYFDQVYRSSNVFDYAVDSVRSAPAAAEGFVDREGKPALVAAPVGAPYRTVVVVRRLGEAVFPVEVEVVFRNGERVKEQWNGRDRWKAFVYEKPAMADYAVVDPSRTLLLDVNYANNSYTTRPQAGAAARKWMLKWMVWLQEAMLTYGFFI